tara:strand:+ start:1034 stop:1405 length:372 start_codon:yes stop_codon:yes gene_type:complete
MDLWLAASLFFGGALSYGIVVKLLTIGSSMEFVTQMTDHTVTFLNTTIHDIAFIKGIKYDSLKTTNVPEEQIELIKQIDEETFKMWKEVMFLKMLDCFPKNHRHLLRKYDWVKVTKPLDDLYK